MRTQNEIYYSASAETYQKYIEKSPSKHEMKCIDGRITGCGKCVAYCQYIGHNGFLTEKLMKSHKCIEKKCDYFVVKPGKKKLDDDDLKNSYDELLNIADKLTEKYEGLKFIKADLIGLNTRKLSYITISNEYPLQRIKNDIEERTGYTIMLEKLNYSFENCVKLIFG